MAARPPCLSGSLTPMSLLAPSSQPSARHCARRRRTGDNRGRRPQPRTTSLRPPLVLCRLLPGPPLALADRLTDTVEGRPGAPRCGREDGGPRGHGPEAWPCGGAGGRRVTHLVQAAQPGRATGVRAPALPQPGDLPEGHRVGQLSPPGPPAAPPPAGVAGAPGCGAGGRWRARVQMGGCWGQGGRGHREEDPGLQPGGLGAGGRRKKRKERELSGGALSCGVYPGPGPSAWPGSGDAAAGARPPGPQGKGRERLPAGEKPRRAV